MTLGHTVSLATERLVTPIEGMHRAISHRWFSMVGPVGAPVRWGHDTIAATAYKAVRLGGALVGAGLDARVRLRPDTEDSLRAFVNGLWGDDLGRHEAALATPMSFFTADGEPLDGAAVANPTGRLVVAVHGLIETDRVWHGADGLVASLDADPALTCVLVRYNSGLRVGENGRRLAGLLEELMTSWPVPVESIALVGRSMGGLVARSAVMAGSSAGHRWVEAVPDVVTIATPHRGSPIEKLAHALGVGLGVAPETRPLGEQFVGSRSGGIKDLREGTIVGDDWGGDDPGSLPEGIRHRFVAGVVTVDPTHPLGALVGDLVVRPASSTGGRHLVPTDVAVVGGVAHADLHRSPAVVELVVGWLGSDREEPTLNDGSAIPSPPVR